MKYAVFTLTMLLGVPIMAWMTLIGKRYRQRWMAPITGTEQLTVNPRWYAHPERATGAKVPVITGLKPISISTSLLIRCLNLAVAIPGVLLAFLTFVVCGFVTPLRRRRIGQFGKPFYEWSWTDVSGLRGRILRTVHMDTLPRMANLLLGQVTLVGPELRSMPIEPAKLAQFQFCKSIPPGMFSLFGLRKLTNIDFADELHTEVDFVRTYSVSTVLGVLVRYPLAAIYRMAKTQFRREITILQIRIDNLCRTEAVAWIIEHPHSGKQPVQVSFVNAHCVNIASQYQKYQKCLSNSHLVLADGFGMKVAGHLLHQPIQQGVNSKDMFPILCRELGRVRGSIYLLGGEPGTAQQVAKWISAHHPNVRIAGVESGFFQEEQAEAVVRKIGDAAPDLLLVAMGVPREELWIAQNLEACGARVAIGVGELFESYSSRIPREPIWMRELAPDWMFQLDEEPGRIWRRYLLGNFAFLYRVSLELVRPKRSAEVLR